MMCIVPFVTYADDTVIFTSSSDIDVIQSNLSQDLDNLSNRFRQNELIFNLEKGKSEVMLFSTGKRLKFVSRLSSQVISQ